MEKVESNQRAKKGLGGSLLSAAKQRWKRLTAAVKGIKRAASLAREDANAFHDSSQEAIQLARSGNATHTSIKLIVTDERELASINYLKQGNADMYTEEMIQQRHSLRASALVIENIRNWWRMLPKEGETEDCSNQISPRTGNFGVIKPVYCAVVVAIQLVMLPKFKMEADPDYDPEEDWDADSKGADIMGYPDFFDSLFELADMWCETAKDVDYALLLKQVFDDVLNAQLKDGLLSKLFKRFGYTPPPFWFKRIGQVGSEQPPPKPAPSPPPEPPPQPQGPPQMVKETSIVESEEDWYAGSDSEESPEAPQPPLPTPPPPSQPLPPAPPKSQPPKPQPPKPQSPPPLQPTPPIARISTLASSSQVIPRVREPSPEPLPKPKPRKEPSAPRILPNRSVQNLDLALPTSRRRGIKIPSSLLFEEDSGQEQEEDFSMASTSAPWSSSSPGRSPNQYIASSALWQSSPPPSPDSPETRFHVAGTENLEPQLQKPQTAQSNATHPDVGTVRGLSAHGGPGVPDLRRRPIDTPGPAQLSQYQRQQQRGKGRFNKAALMAMSIDSGLQSEETCNWFELYMLAVMSKERVRHAKRSSKPCSVELLPPELMEDSSMILDEEHGGSLTSCRFKVNVLDIFQKRLMQQPGLLQRQGTALSTLSTRTLSHMDALETHSVLQNNNQQDLFNSKDLLPSLLLPEDPFRPPSSGTITFHSASRLTTPQPLQQRPHTTAGDSGRPGAGVREVRLGLPRTSSPSMSHQNRGLLSPKRSTPLTPGRAGLIRQYQFQVNQIGRHQSYENEKQALVRKSAELRDAKAAATKGKFWARSAAPRVSILGQPYRLQASLTRIVPSWPQGTESSL